MTPPPTYMPPRSPTVGSFLKSRLAALLAYLPEFFDGDKVVVLGDHPHIGPHEVRAGL